MMKKTFSLILILLSVVTLCGCEDAPLPEPQSKENSDVIRLCDDDFAERTATGIVLVDFYADWCGPCRMMGPYLEAFATDVKDRMATAKVNVDNCPKVSRKFGIQALPTLVVFVDGKPVKQFVGAFQDKAEIRNFVADVLIEHGGKNDAAEEKTPDSSEEPGVQDAGLNGN